MSILNTLAGAVKSGLGKADIGTGSQGKPASTDPYLKNRNYQVIITQHMEEGPEKGKTRQVVGAVPASVQLDQQIGWKAPFGAGLVGDGMVGDLLAMTGNRLVGQVLTMQVWQGSASDFDFSIQFELRAWSDPSKDVIQPLQTLLKMSLPSLDDTGFLMSPGPILNAEGIKKLGERLTQVTTSVANSALSATKSTTVNGGVAGFVAGAVSGVVAGGSAAIDTIKKSGVLRKNIIEDQLKNKISINVGNWFSMSNVVILNVQHNIKGQTPHARSGLIQAAEVTVTFRPMFAVTAEDVESIFSKQDFSKSPASSESFAGNSGYQATAFPVVP